MAILTTEPAPEPQPIDIQAWTVETATAAISQVTIATPGDLPGAIVNLQIPLDDVSTSAAPRERPSSTTAAKEGGYYKRKEPIRRDSLKRRESLLKGNEGTRRRLRWENDRLLNNPHAEPPQPKDWEVHPTHPVHNVPYYLAPLWDAGLARQHAERKTSAAKAKASSRTVANKPTAPGVVPKELREKLKRSRGAKGLLMDLESEVRAFVTEWEDSVRRAADDDGLPADPDSSDDEIVFVGRNGVMSDWRGSMEGAGKREIMLFETAEEDQGGSFGRWLVHHIGVYYGLKTWSVTVGDPARREAYVGLKDVKMRTGRQAGCGPLPRPLWALV
ncbi:hypothetical protein PMIN06_000756 [Paraphaeosphaeria minitans]|uniref:R3H-associated N-terminal domain-containing protein n=1 Tax=Paraphaeosphaeria minitans TaxID=565426 RepID=A0A9P6GFE4_9PLEO|nr:hypothetical protein PMIN01_07680 [Paraphaeosphaeria minitans]